MTSIQLVVFIACLSSTLAQYASRRNEAFFYHEIVPDVLSVPPEGILKVTFPDGAEAELGNELLVSEVRGVPTLEWDVSSQKYYTVVFCDPDGPSRADPESRSFLHWLVVNVPGDDVTAGVTLTSLKNSNPTPGTGLHRYLFLVYEQPGVIDFEEQPDVESRHGFSPEDFAAKYSFGTLVAGNFYQTQNPDN